MNNKFIAKEARVLVYNENMGYAVYVANNLSQINEIVEKWGKPHIYMNGFQKWEEMETARKCYEWLVSGLPRAKQNVVKPTDIEEDWFWQKQLENEHFVKDIAEITKWDEALPDSPNRYAVELKSENFMH